MFLLYEGLLYKREFSLTLLRCTTSEEGKRIMEDIHDGECGSHIRDRSLATKALSAQDYWLMLLNDAIEMVRKYDKCEQFSPYAISHPPH